MCMSTAPAGWVVALQTKVPIQTTLGVARREFAVDIPKRLSRITHSAEFPFLLSSPESFRFMILRAPHLTDGVSALTQRPVLAPAFEYRCLGNLHPAQVFVVLVAERIILEQSVLGLHSTGFIIFLLVILVLCITPADCC